MRFLIVEDEMLLALELQHLLEDLGHEVVGIAPDSGSAVVAARSGADFALVDVNLRDGLTGKQIAADLAKLGISVLFITGHPGLLNQQVEGAVGILPKPLANEELEQAVRYVTALKAGLSPPSPPRRMRVLH